MDIKLDDREIMIPAYSPVCSFCTHLLDNGKGRKCKAFKEIPMPIWLGKNDHRKPYHGDNGIRFKPVKK